MALTNLNQPTPAAGSSILTLNGGSSSIKLAVFGAAGGGGEEISYPRLLEGKVERIGSPGTRLTLRALPAPGVPLSPFSLEEEVPAGRPVADLLLDRLAAWDEAEERAEIGAAGHRVVHGLQHTAPARITPALLAELRTLSPYSPEHMPLEIELIEAFGRRFPAVPQVACFDTAFHRSMPRVAKLLPIPRRLDAKGVQRYGFHGLSYAFLIEELARVAGPEAARGRVILAHLGNGASLAAVRGGASVDTSMGFTPTAGIPMGTRSGDLDPGLLTYLRRTEGMTGERFVAMANDESGLLGVSEVSSDMRDLLEIEGADVRAAEAVELFSYQVKKWIGAFAAALGGVDTLVFSAGIGENCPEVRARICAGLGFLGIELDEERNRANAALISREGGAAAVRVVRTDEELMIARSVRRLLGGGAGRFEEDPR